MRVHQLRARLLQAHGLSLYTFTHSVRFWIQVLLFICFTFIAVHHRFAIGSYRMHLQHALRSHFVPSLCAT